MISSSSRSPPHPTLLATVDEDAEAGPEIRLVPTLADVRTGLLGTNQNKKSYLKANIVVIYNKMIDLMVPTFLLEENLDNYQSKPLTVLSEQKARNVVHLLDVEMQFHRDFFSEYLTNNIRSRILNLLEIADEFVKQAKNVEKKAKKRKLGSSTASANKHHQAQSAFGFLVAEWLKQFTDEERWTNAQESAKTDKSPRPTSEDIDHIVRNLKIFCLHHLYVHTIETLDQLNQSLTAVDNMNKTNPLNVGITILNSYEACRFLCDNWTEWKTVTKKLNDISGHKYWVDDPNIAKGWRKVLRPSDATGAFPENPKGSVQWT